MGLSARGRREEGVSPLHTDVIDVAQGIIFMISTSCRSNGHVLVVEIGRGRFFFSSNDGSSGWLSQGLVCVLSFAYNIKEGRK
jgi:hypothetical protein